MSAPKKKGPLTIRDFAALANTSTATISRVFSNKPGVSDAKREKIMELAERVGFSPNRIAQNLALQKSHTLGLIAADLRNPFYVEFFRHVQKIVSDQGYQVLIADSEMSVEKERYNITVMRQHRAEGLIIFPLHDWDESSGLDHLVELRLQRFPFVVVGEINNYGFDCVTNEENETAYRLTKHLIDLGHRRIGFVGAEATNRCIRERVEGVTRALRESGLELDPRNMVEHHEGWPDEMMKMLDRKDRPTGIVMVNDVCALISYRNLLEKGIRVPEDLSIVTFGDAIWMDRLAPGYTTTRENSAEVAAVALQMLFDRIDDPTRKPDQRLIPQDIVTRGSSARTK